MTVVAAAIALAGPARAAATGPTPDSLVRAAVVDQLPFLARLNEADLARAAEAARRALLKDQPDAEGPAEAPALGLEDGDMARLIVLTVAGPGQPARVFVGTGPGLEAAIADAVRKCVESGAPAGAAEHLLVALEVAHQVREAEGGLAAPGVDGVLVGREQVLVIPPVESMLLGIVGDRGVSAPQLQRVLTLREAEAGPSRLFRTVGAFADSAGARAMYRGHDRIDRSGPADVTRAARQGAAYLARSVDDDGRFAYRVDAATGESAGDYNILRHAGATWALWQAAGALQDDGLRAPAERATDYLLARARPAPQAPGLGGEGQLVIVEDGELKLGGVALACLALAERRRITGDAGRDDAMRALADWMVATQADTGQFVVHKMRYGALSLDPMISEYYPGEAAFALVRVFEATEEERYLDAAERGVRWLIEERDAGLAPVDLPEDHWLLYALEALHAHRPKPLYADHAARLAGAIMTGQRRGREVPDEFGGWGYPARAGPAAVRAEGLLAAAKLAERAGDADLAGRQRLSAELAAAFLMRCQCTGTALLWVTDRHRFAGAVRSDLTDFDLRIDTTQHTVSALLALSEAMGQP